MLLDYSKFHFHSALLIHRQAISIKYVSFRLQDRHFDRRKPVQTQEIISDSRITADILDPARKNIEQRAAEREAHHQNLTRTA